MMVIGRLAAIFGLLLFAAVILAVSIFRTVSPEYVFSQATPQPRDATAAARLAKPVDYYLVYPGILPDHFIWPLKAFRDRLWLFLTTDPAKKSELLLLFADKRIGAAKALFEGSKVGLAVETAGKGEKYLEEAVNQEQMAREKKIDTSRLLDRLALANLKHREILEDMYLKANEDARPKIVEIMNYPKRLFEKVKLRLLTLNRPVPQNPFEE